MKGSPGWPLLFCALCVVGTGMLGLVPERGWAGEEPGGPEDLAELHPGWLGFGFHYRRDADRPERAGWLYVRGVAPTGPAAKAGLASQDLIVAIDGEVFRQERYTEVLRLFAGIEPGDTVVLTVRRGTEELKIPITAAPTTPAQLERWRANYLLAREQEERQEGCCGVVEERSTLSLAPAGSLPPQRTAPLVV